MADSSITLKTYPSGYLGSDQASKTRPMPVAQIRDMIINMTATASPDTRTANQDIVDIFTSSVSKPDIFHDFDYRERVLTLAMKAFGVTDIYVWISSQRYSRYWSINHADWIDETLSYIYHGGTRRYIGAIWKRSLNVQENIGGPTKQSQLVTELFGTDGKSGQDTSLHSMIQKWCSREGGFDDLLNSINLLFGK